jgi:hypothetical protein
LPFEPLVELPLPEDILITILGIGVFKLYAVMMKHLDGRARL